MSDARRHLRRRRRRRTRRVVLAVVGAAVLLLVLAAGALAAFRYLPALDEARALRTDLEQLVTTAKDAGLGLDRATLTRLKTDEAAARARFTHLAGMLATDPLVALVRTLPPTRDAVVGTDAVVASGGDLLDAAEAGLGLADRYVTIKEQQSAAAGGAGQGSALAELVELMATGSADVDRIVAAVDKADAAMRATPPGLPGPVASIRDLIRQRLADYGPALRGYAQVDGTLPDILGWDHPKRYLVLTQDPAELRPTGGIIGSYGVLTFDKGHITERTFNDVALLDVPGAHPFVAAPPELARYLLGPSQSWDLADSNWSPDFPTSARQAVSLYLNEGGAGPIDGVLGITTYTIDELLKITGPVTLPGYGVTIASGETTLKTLQQTRVATAPGTSRKAFLSAFANQLFGALLGLSPRRWVDLAASGEELRSGRLLLAWFADTAAETEMATLGFDGGIRSDSGDFVYPLDSNVSPVSKASATTDRELDLTVRLDSYGNAADALTVRWTNWIDTPNGKPYRDLAVVGDLTTLGMYFRLYVPERSRVESVSAGTTLAISAPADVGLELGRTVIANYFRIPPGPARLQYTWTSPYAADQATDGTFTYRITIQKQPGLRPGRLHLSIRVPPGSEILDASAGLTVSGETATVEATFDQDLVVVIRYRISAGAG